MRKDKRHFRNFLKANPAVSRMLCAVALLLMFLAAGLTHYGILVGPIWTKVEFIIFLMCWTFVIFHLDVTQESEKEKGDKP